jgi:hypothetical protein
VSARREPQTHVEGRNLRKRRAVLLGLIAGVLLAGIAGVGAHVIAVAGAGTALTICLVGLGPALAAVALVTAVGAVAPPPTGSIPISSATIEAPAEAQT